MKRMQVIGCNLPDAVSATYGVVTIMELRNRFLRPSVVTLGRHLTMFLMYLLIVCIYISVCFE